MPEIVIDLGAVSVPVNHHIYKCFPGQSYRYYAAMVESRTVFLDVHGLATLGLDAMAWQPGDLLDLVRQTRIREDERLTKRTPTRKQRSPKASARLDHRNLNMAIGLYQTVEPGDLIVVPAEGYDKDVYIGEVTDEPLRQIHIPSDRERLEQDFIGRPVRWLDRRPKTGLSADLVNHLHTPIAFFDIGRSIYEEIYRLAYKNFLFNDLSFGTFDTSKDKFRNYDNLVSALWMEYLVAAGVARFDANHSSFQKLSLFDATSQVWSHSLNEELFLNINSPGTIGVRAVGLFPLVALGLWALSSLNAQEPFSNEIKVTVRHINQGSPNCEIAVSKEIKEYLETIGYDRWKEACEVAERMRTDAKISTRSGVGK